jgi:bifunctional polynucleotide phosphatase/kinase
MLASVSRHPKNSSWGILQLHFNLVASIPSRPLMLHLCRRSSGKSTFFRNVLSPKGFLRINQDTLKSKQACLQALEDAMKSGTSRICIDNTNPTRETRKEYIQMAHRMNYQVSCAYLATDSDLVQHLNHFRSITEHVEPIPNMAYNVFYKNFQEPTAEEGFDVIYKIDFIPQFASEQHLKMFRQYLY